MTIQGMSFYDFVGKLVPGILIWAPWLSIYCPVSWEASNLIFFIVAFVGFYLTGFIWTSLIYKLTQKLRRRPFMLITARSYISHAYNELRNKWHSKEINKNNIEILYLEAYTYAQKNNVLGPVPILESHENFLRVIWPLIIYFIFVMLWQPFEIEVISLKILLSFLFICLLSIPFIWYQIQMKIYKYIWEAELFLLENDKLNTSTEINK